MTLLESGIEYGILSEREETHRVGFYHLLVDAKGEIWVCTAGYHEDGTRYYVSAFDPKYHPSLPPIQLYD